MLFRNRSKKLETHAGVLPASIYNYSFAAAAQVMGHTLLLLLYFQPKLTELMPFLAKVSAAKVLVILDEVECLRSPCFRGSGMSFQLAETESGGWSTLMFQPVVK